MEENTTLELNYVAHSGNGASKDLLLAKILDEYLQAMERGTPVALEELVSRYPSLKEDLQVLTKSLDFLHSATGKFKKEDTKGVADRHAKRLGDFEIGREIGRGGMGVVYEAHQLSLDRKVALKVLPFASMLDQKQVARFRNEAQAAAQLQHPGIVPVFAVGEERGVHYYAMQFVSGQSLAEVIRELHAARSAGQCGRDINAISTRVDATTLDKRVPISSNSHQLSKAQDFYRRVAELGIEAARSLHYAHECGVVHRDIKPSNLLLDNSGNLWITDFGLARVQDNPGMTVTGDVVGTLRYMSPEQASGKPASVDQRTDVYALGATLFELLTLKAAFPGRDRRRGLQVTDSQEPPSPRSLDPSIPSDLETIVMTAMAKSRDERYTTAQALADDLDRFLKGEPTLARRPTLIDRGGKWLRRHRHLALASCSVLTLITAISSAGALMLARETADKEAALVRAEENLEQARVVVDRFGTHFSRQLERLPGSESIRKELLQDTLNYYKQFIANGQDNPDLQLELAMASFKAAEISRRLGRSEEAYDLFSSASGRFAALDAGNGNPQHLQHRATCLNELGLLEIQRGDVQPAREFLESAIQLQSRLALVSQDSPTVRCAQAEMLMNLGLLDNRVGDTAKGLSAIERAISVLRELTAQCPEVAQHRHDLAIAINNLSFVQQQSDLTAAKQSSIAAIDIIEKLLANPEHAPSFQLQLREDLALCYNNLGAIESHLDRHREACRLHQQAIELQADLNDRSPAVVSHRSNLAVSYNNLGQAFAQDGKVKESNAAFQQARELFRQLTQDFPAVVAYQSSLAGVLNNQSMSLEHVGEFESASHLLEKAIERQQEAVGRAPQIVAYRESLSTHYVNYGRVLRKLDRTKDAASVALDHLQLWPADGEHMYLVARELALAAESADAQPEDDWREQVLDDVVDLLQESYSAEQRPRTQSIDETDFASLREDDRFRNLISQRQ